MLSFLKKKANLFRRHWLTIGFILGFITDLFFLNKIDSLVDNLILLFYLTIATISLFILYAGSNERAGEYFSFLTRRYIPPIMQYSFGGLLSGMLIFYGRSGDWIANAPFLILIIVVIVANETLDKYHHNGQGVWKFIYNLTLYFTGLFSYMVLLVPVILGEMGDYVFFTSGLIALFLVFLLLKFLRKIASDVGFIKSKLVTVSIIIVYLFFNTLYLMNLIPPIPLSLVELTVASSVNRLSNGDYQVLVEKEPWYKKINPLSLPVVHPVNNEVACFARIYAPTQLKTKIFHRWEYKDKFGNWQEYFRLGYIITHSKRGSFRGYTELQNFFPGLWRCSVETKRGQVLGREVFRIETEGKTNDLQIIIK